MGDLSRSSPEPGSAFLVTQLAGFPSVTGTVFSSALMVSELGCRTLKGIFEYNYVGNVKLSPGIESWIACAPNGLTASASSSTPISVGLNR